AHDGVAPFVGLAPQLHPFFEQIDFHRQLPDLALKFSDLALVLGDMHRLGQLVCELARLVLADPQPNQIARETMPARELMQARPAVEKFFGNLTIELRTESPMSSHGLSSDKPVARANSYLPGCPVLGVHSRDWTVTTPTLPRGAPRWRARSPIGSSSG